MHEALMMGRPEEARARSALLLAAGEQMALDGGCWTLAWLVTLLPRPRYGNVPRRAEGDDEEPYSRLMDQRWVAAHLSWLCDAIMITERRRRLRQPGGRRGGRGRGAAAD